MSQTRIQLQTVLDAAGVKEGAREMESAFETIGRRAKENEAIFGDLKRTARGAVAALGVGFSAREIVQWGADAEAAIAELVRATGAAGADLRAIEADMRAVFRETPAAIGEVAAVMGELATRTGAAGQPLRDLTRDVLQFSRIAKEDAVSGARDLGQLINALGLSAADARPLLDRLTFASQATGIGVSTMTRSVIEAGPAFQALGFDLDRSLALFAQFERVGARPAEVLATLNRVLVNMAREGATDAQAAFGQLIDRIRTAPTLLEAVTISADAFGARVGGKVAEDIRAGLFDVEEFAKALSEADGTFERTSEGMETAAERIARAMNGIRDTFSPVGAQGMGLAASGIELLTNRVQDVAKVTELFGASLPVAHARFQLFIAEADRSFQDSVVGRLLVPVSSRRTEPTVLDARIDAARENLERLRAAALQGWDDILFGAPTQDRAGIAGGTAPGGGARPGPATDPPVSPRAASSLADLAARIEAEERLARAQSMGAHAYAEAQAAEERAMAVRRASAGLTGAEAKQVEELAGRLHDLALQRKEADQDAVRTNQVEALDQERARLEEVLDLTRNYRGSVEDLERAIEGLSQSHQDADAVARLVAAGLFDTEAATAHVDAVRKARTEFEALMQSRRSDASTDQFRRGLEREITSMERSAELQRIHLENSGDLRRGMAEEEDLRIRSEVIAAGVRAGMKEESQLLQDLAERYVEAGRRMREAADDARDYAEAQRDAARASGERRAMGSAAVGAAGSAIGGIGQELAGVVQGGIMGGPAGMVIAALGTLGRMLGRGDGGELAREQARLAEEARRAAEALSDLSNNLRADMDVRRLRLSGQDDAADLRALGVSQERERQDLEQRFREASGGMMPQHLIDQIRRDFGVGDPGGWTTDQLREFLGSTEGSTISEVLRRALEDWIELQEFHAAELQDLLDRQAQREEEEARRRAAAAASFEMDMERVTIALFGTDREARAHDLERAMERQLEANRKLLDEGVITAEQFEKMADLLRQQVNVALEEFDAAARRAADAAKAAAESERMRAEEAARAERLRQATDEERLRIQLLRARGEIEAAQAAEGALAVEIALRDGRSSNYLIMLEQLNAIQLLNAAQQQAAQSADTAARALGGMGSALNAVPTFNAAAAMTRATSGVEIATRSMASAPPVVQNFQVTIQGANKSPDQLLTEIELAAERRYRRGGRPFETVEA